MTGHRVMMGVGRGHDVDAGGDGQLGQTVVADRIEGVPVVPQLDHHVVAAEVGDEPIPG